MWPADAFSCLGLSKQRNKKEGKYERLEASVSQSESPDAYCSQQESGIKHAQSHSNGKPLSGALHSNNTLFLHLLGNKLTEIPSKPLAFSLYTNTLENINFLYTWKMEAFK